MSASLIPFPTRPAAEASLDSLRVQRILDRLQVLSLEQPHSAEFFLEISERFLTRHEDRWTR